MISAQARLSEMFNDYLRERDGVARMSNYRVCADGWYVEYTTSRIQGGPHDGLFAAVSFHPVDGGWERDEIRLCDKRSEAKTRCESWWLEHETAGKAKAAAKKAGRA